MNIKILKACFAVLFFTAIAFLIVIALSPLLLVMFPGADNGLPNGGGGCDWATNPSCKP